MLKKWLLRSLISLMILLSVLLITAPAQLLENQLQSNVPGLQITSSSGGFWSGQFQQLNYQGNSLNKLSWNISILSLISASYGAELDIEDPLFTGELFIEKGFSNSLAVSDINASQSLVELTRVYRPLQLLNPIGELVWTDVSLAMSDVAFTEGEGNIQWKNAKLNIKGTIIPLGTINLQPTVVNNELILKISSDKILDLKGSIKVSRNKRYQIQVSLKEALPANIYNTVRYMARPDGKGRLTFSKAGRW